MKTLRTQLSKPVELIEWSEDSLGTMLWKYPAEQSQIKYGAKLTVRESQYAFIVAEDNVADVFKPGLYSLTVENMPRLAILNKWDKEFHGTITADIYFFKTKFFLDQKWKLRKPLMVKDDEFGLVRINLSGLVDIRIVDTEQLLSQLNDNKKEFTVTEACSIVEGIILSKFPSVITNKKFSVIKPTPYDEELWGLAQEEVNNELEKFGLEAANLKFKATALGSEN
ncbi:SPFH domain-containing protein [Chryseosolibacter indicus]|uniref:SPFH domain-containing protein n=1 Tax=Chryseosolibacter indicus TaxID=2782351 RepID=A0ABS5VZA2_9BACT|nr:SPFH domain-containing protein [Chryseosolibacter indicus]MBT1705361.1 SPFH domain-containing protein [Chryseosolibacter indicus]